MIDLIKSILLKMFWAPPGEERRIWVMYVIMMVGTLAFMAMAEFMVSCTPVPPKVEEPIVKVCGYGEWCKSWDKYFPYNDFDVSKIKFPICSKGNKKDLFRSYAQAIAFAESNYKSDETYNEGFLDSTTGKPAVSVGIFQLSVSDKIYYRQYIECSTLELKDGASNASCAGRIMQHLLNKIPDIETLGKYWAVARSTNKRHQVTLKEFYRLEPQCK